MIGTAAAILGASAIGAGASMFGASSAANAQKEAAAQAAATSNAQYQQTRSDLSPYRQIGQTASDQLTNRLGELTSPIKMDQATLDATPGYQFNLKYGLKAAQNSAAARGLGVSGAALKGASAFATGLADSTYQNQFSNANTNQTNAYNRLSGLVNTGENAAAQTGVLGTSAANTQASAQMAGGNAQAAGYNAMGGAVNSAANNIAGYAAYKGMYNNNSNPNNNNYAPSNAWYNN